jgi:hypothetical protein
LLDNYIESYVIMRLLGEMGFTDRGSGRFPQDKEDPKSIFGPRSVYRMISVQDVEAKTLGKPLRGWVMDFWEEIAKFLLGRKGGESNQKLKGEERCLNDW